MSYSTRRGRTSMLGAIVVMALCAGSTSCSDDDGAVTGDGGGKNDGSATGLRCGSKTCDPGQVCCLDCDGTGSCGAPGAACPGFACPPESDAGTGDAGGDAATPDAGAVMSCGSTTCASGKVCCVDCDGTGLCGPPGTACLGAACRPPDGGPAADGATSCGTEGNICCATGDPCGAGMTCCSGVPYPEGGECYKDTCPYLSDRNIKERFAPLDGQQAEDVLEKLAALPVSRWSYVDGDPRVRHLGPMAQDFRAAFGLGSSHRHIDGVDANGVAVAAIQGLYRHVQELKRDNAALRRSLKRLERRLRERITD